MGAFLDVVPVAAPFGEKEFQEMLRDKAAERDRQIAALGMPPLLASDRGA